MLSFYGQVWTTYSSVVFWICPDHLPLNIVRKKMVLTWLNRKRQQSHYFLPLGPHLVKHSRPHPYPLSKSRSLLLYTIWLDLILECEEVKTSSRFIFLCVGWKFGSSLGALRQLIQVYEMVLSNLGTTSLNLAKFNPYLFWENSKEFHYAAVNLSKSLSYVEQWNIFFCYLCRPWDSMRVFVEKEWKLMIGYNNQSSVKPISPSHVRPSLETIKPCSQMQRKEPSVFKHFPWDEQRLDPAHSLISGGDTKTEIKDIDINIDISPVLLKWSAIFNIVSLFLKYWDMGNSQTENLC